jgi:phosphodiesterase/alkaline phosphatase D-like protein
MAARALSALAAAALAAASRPVSNVHLALSSDPTQMHVQWTSAQGDVLGAGDSTVQWGASPRALTSSAAGFNWTWVDSSTSRKYTANEATMAGLAPGSTYFFRVGSSLDGWSAVNSFVATRTAAQITPEAPLRIAWFGDLGWLYAQALPFLQTEVAQGAFDHVVHVGDYAYDLQDGDGVWGDQFQASIEPISATTPYMGCEGNHEGAMAFLHYSNRFAVFAADNSSGTTPSIPGLSPGPNNHWYTYTVGPVFFAAMSTEAYFCESSSARAAPSGPRKRTR